MRNDDAEVTVGFARQLSERREDDHETTKERKHETEIANQEIFNFVLSYFRVFVILWY